MLVQPTAACFLPAVEEDEEFFAIRLEERVHSVEVIDVEGLPLSTVSIQGKNEIMWAVA